MVEVHDDGLGAGVFLRDGIEGTQGLDVDALIIERVFWEFFFDPLGHFFCFGEDDKGGLFLREIVAGGGDGMAEAETEKDDARLLGGAEGLADHFHQLLCGTASVLGIDLAAEAFEKKAAIVFYEVDGLTGISLSLIDSDTGFHKKSARGQEAFLARGGRYPVEKEGNE